MYCSVLLYVNWVCIYDSHIFLVLYSFCCTQKTLLSCVPLVCLPSNPIDLVGHWLVAVAVPQRVGCCVVPPTSQIAVRILDCLGQRQVRGGRLIFPSLPSPSPFPSDPNRKIVCIAISPRVAWCVTAKSIAIVAALKDEEEKSDTSFSFLFLLLAWAPAWAVDCLCCSHRLIVVLWY